MPEGTTWSRPEGGFQTWVTLPGATSSIRLFLAGIERGVSIAPGPAHDLDGRYVSSFRLGYGSGSADDVRRGVQRLGEAARALRSAPALDAPSLALHV
jgi:DNA-binding transcriptional MocR family regulator